jgi:outer membrane lipoprotein-sorting protein
MSGAARTGTARTAGGASRIRAMRTAALVAIASALIPLSGCLFTTRKLPVPKAPSVTQTVPASDLVHQLNQRWENLKSLYAKVEITFSTMKAKEGTEKDYTSFPGIILMRKPEMLRVYGRYPIVGAPMFNMVSDGKTFTLYANPPKNLAYTGPATLTHKSANLIENMRPGFFLDALVVRGLDGDEEYGMTTDSHTVEDAKKKHLLLIPEYVLTISRHKPGSQELRTLRVIHFHRDDLLPYQQEIYDEQGNPETLVSYGSYVDFGGSKYPSTVTIKRPQEEFQIVMTVEKVTENLDLKDDQFQIEIPPDVKVQTLQ